MTTCRWCQTSLTRQQIARKRTYCSRACAKAHWHAQHPDRSIAIGRRSWQPGGKNRANYIARLKTVIAGCTNLMDAYRLGYRNGYARGAEWRR